MSDLGVVGDALRTQFGLDVADLQRLPGEVDENFRVACADGGRFVFKLHDARTDSADLDLQDAALRHADTTCPDLGGPRLVARHPLTTGDAARTGRLVSWVDGTPWSSLTSDDRLLRALGRAVARTDEALCGFDHAGLDRPYRWNMLQVERLPTGLDPWADAVLAGGPVLRAALAALPLQAIHNDANENNVIVAPDGAVALIDFGDVVRGPRIVSLGVAIAYAMCGQVDPLRAACRVLEGYHAQAPLRPDELAVLDGVVRTRLAMSVINAVEQARANPSNAEYLQTSQNAIRDLIALLEHVDPPFAHAAYRDACGYVPVAAERAVQRFFGSAAFDPHPIVDVDLTTAATLDWSAAAARHAPVPVDGPAVGRYLEDRSVYDAPAFQTPFGERRSVHLGIDIFVPAGTLVRAPLDGILCASAMRPGRGDYGGVLILEHRTPSGTPFWLLLGHLAAEGLATAVPGRAVRRGEAIGSVGTREENGGWEPHIHAQLFTDLLGRTTDLDGVARPSQVDVWSSISPCPAPLLVGVDGRAATAPVASSAERILRRRRVNLSTALSLSYREPLHIVAGEGATLIDDQGRRWIDLVNNVAHVGHEHPRVVDAIATQARRLNTNTRYLHENLVRYAERLRALFPDPLSVVFMTNSGSEAVDLALRLARTATGREGVLTLDWAYHGNLTSLIEISPYKFKRSGGSGPTPRVRVCDLPDPYRGSAGDDGPSYAEHVAVSAADLVASGFAPAAFIHESVSGCGGQVELATGYLPAAYAHARAAGAVCIADEVQCGLGRVGEHWWAFETHGVVPDIVALGKPLGNGHPVGAVVTTPQIARGFANGMEYFNTFGGNPVSAAAALAVLDVIEDERLMAHASTVGDRLMRGLRELSHDYEIIGDVRGRGLFLGVDLVEDGHTRRAATADAAEVLERLKARGVLCSTDGPSNNVLKIKPPMVLADNDVDRVLQAFDDTLRELPNRRG